MDNKVTKKFPTNVFERRVIHLYYTTVIFHTVDYGHHSPRYSLEKKTPKNPRYSPRQPRGIMDF